MKKKKKNECFDFFQMLDGAYSICLGKLSWLSGRVVAVGGNGSVSVLDRNGVEIFWTVMSDMVSALTIFDFDGDGENEVKLRTMLFVH